MTSVKTDDGLYLGTQPLGKLLWKFALPCVLAMLVSALYNICDQIFIGHSSLDYLGNAATSVVFPLTVVAMALSLAFGDGAAAYLSLCQGKCDTRKVHRSVANSLIMVAILSLLLTAGSLIGAEPLARILGATEQTLPLALDYLRIIVAGFPIFMLGGCLSQIIRADGAPQVAMASMLAGALTNIILDPIFIYPWGLNLGIAGAAWATVIGQVVTLAVVVWYLPRSHVFRLGRESFRLDKEIIATNFKYGISTLISQLAIVVIAVVTNMSLVRAGVNSEYGVDIPIAVFGIVMKVFTVVISFAIGISVGAQPIFGYNYGAKNYGRVRKLYWLIINCMLVVGIAGTLVFELAPDLIIGIFGGESELYWQFARLTFRIFLSATTATCIVRATAITFQAVGKPIPSTIVSLSRDILAYVPLCIILSHFYGINGVLWAAPIADLCGLVLAVIAVIPFLRELRQQELAAKTVK